MLVLSRKPGQRVFLETPAGRVVLTVIEIDRGKIRLGVEAPKEIAVYREEIAPGTGPKEEPS